MSNVTKTLESHRNKSFSVTIFTFHFFRHAQLVRVSECSLQENRQHVLSGQSKNYIRKDNCCHNPHLFHSGEIINHTVNNVKTFKVISAAELFLRF